MLVPKLRSPVVLVHGLFGFDHVRLWRWKIASYFPGIPEYLRHNGNHVLVARVSPLGGVADRAAELKEFLDKEVPEKPVHLIAHSMGGLDCRYLISRLGMASRVLSLTTVGTPHRGTSFADWTIGRLEAVLKPVFQRFGLPRQAFYDLTTTSCRAFNEHVPDVAEVRYFSVAGRHDASWFQPEWRVPHRVVLQREGPNDGVVSLTSATYGESLEVWEGDHFSLINWPNPVAHVRGRWRDRAPFYGGLLRRLADEGF